MIQHGMAIMNMATMKITTMTKMTMITTMMAMITTMMAMTIRIMKGVNFFLMDLTETAGWKTLTRRLVLKASNLPQVASMSRIFIEP